ncbi:MAG: type III secretion system outer membrane ring subunit SctC [Vitreoscilla sp.]
MPFLPRPFPLQPLLALAVAAALFASDPAKAASIPIASEAPLSLTAREQPIQAFLQDFFGRLDLPVDVSPNVHGQVSGSFNAPPQKILRDISRSFGLLTYYDGVVVHVYAAGEIATRALATTPAVSERVRRSVQEARLVDTHNTLRATPEGSLIAIGTPRFVEQVEDLYRVAQAANLAQAPLGFKVFYLRYAWAQDVTMEFGGSKVQVPGVASILRSLVTNRGHQGATETDAHTTVPKLRGQGLARNGANDRLGTLGAPDAGARATDNGVAHALAAAYAGGPGGAPADDAAAPAAASTVDPGQVRIEVDQRLNAVIVRDLPERMAQYQELVSALDVEPQSLEIEATIVDIDTTKARKLGINWRFNGNGSNSILFGRGDSSDALLQPGVNITPIGEGGFVSAVLGDAGKFIARINALESDGAARVVSSPQVVTLSNVEAVFDNSQTFYVRVNGYQDVDLFNVTAGTNLRVTPHVFKDDGQVRIKLLVRIEDGSLTSQTVDNLPVVERSSVNTQALIQEGQSLLIGGMMRQSTNNGVDKVPFLGDIPLLGNLFKTRNENNEHVERLFLISPRLAPSRSTLASAAVGAGLVDTPRGLAPASENTPWLASPPVLDGTPPAAAPSRSAGDSK